MSRTILYSFLGTQLDGGSTEKRWKRWRPNVGVAASSGYKVDTLVIFYEKSFSQLAERVKADALDLAAKSDRAHFDVQLMPVDIQPYDLVSTYLMLEDLRKSLSFSENDKHLLSISTGTHIMQIACFLMVESKRWPGNLAQVSPGVDIKSNVSVIDLDLSDYDPVMNRYRLEEMEGESLLKLGIPTENEAFNKIISKLQRVAERSAAPILLMGPTGAGKTQMARRLFETKKKASGLSGEFVEVNCATLRGDTVMSTLFGHKKGAFTGAVDSRDGVLKKANNGLLFLDEIGELGLEEQAMLLHALEDKVFTPVGSDVIVKSDFQFIAGTNRDLVRDVRAGRFRADLLARINTWSFTLPGLKERAEDISPNIDFELAKLQIKDGIAYRFSSRARERYLAFAKSNDASWEGNFRDLSASIQRMTVMSSKGVIDDEVVDDEIEMLAGLWQSSKANDHKRSLINLLGDILTEELTPFDAAQLEYVLSHCLETDSYAELGRRLYGEQASSNPSQRARNYLRGYGLDIKIIHSILSSS